MPLVTCIDFVLQKHSREIGGAQAQRSGSGLELDSVTQQSASHYILGNPEVHPYHRKSSEGLGNIYKLL